MDERILEFYGDLLISLTSGVFAALIVLLSQDFVKKFSGTTWDVILISLFGLGVIWLFFAWFLKKISLQEKCWVKDKGEPSEARGKMKKNKWNLKEYLNLLKMREGICFVVILIIIVLIFNIFLRRISSNLLSFLIMGLGIIVSLIIIVAILVIILNYLLKQLSLKEIRKYQNIKNSEVAIILGKDKWPIWQSLIISSYLGIRFLIKYLENNKKRFKICITPNKKEFDSITKDKHIRTLYLIGHGSKYGFCLNEKEDALRYENYKNYKGSKKDEIHLYHCTHSKENPKSIIDYLVKKENRIKCYIANKQVLLIDYILEFYNLYKSSLKKNE